MLRLATELQASFYFIQLCCRRNSIFTGIISNSIDSVALALAVAAVGAVFSCTAPDMGPNGILERYRQIQPVIIFAETEVMYAGKPIDLIPKVTEVAKDLGKHGLREVVLFPSVLSGKVPYHGLKNW